jgi:hypothetical protein
MEGCEFFVEIHSEEIEASSASLKYGMIMSEDVMEVRGSLCCNGTNLLVAACISWYEENGYAFDL